ncbi:MAG: hypothetical protein JO306_06180 [Gemmatimonadetes bacterium]|nr:hypothetical protein [Gemmatimonadota bacterium]
MFQQEYQDPNPGGGGGGGYYPGTDPNCEVYPDGSTSDGRHLIPGPNGWWDPIYSIWREVTSPYPRGTYTQP